MANINAPKGFIPVRHMNGSPWNGLTKYFLIPSSDATAIFVGDLVKHAGSSGAAGTVVSGVDCEGIPTAALATAGTTGQDLLGPVVGFLVDPTNLAQKYRLASTARIALVCVDPSVVFEVQEDAVGSNLAATDIGSNIPYTTTSGNTSTGVSKMEIDSSAVATTSTLPFKIVGLVKRPDVAFGTSSTDHAKFEVVMNTGLYMPNVAGV